MSQQNTILIVDDDEINRAILEEIFSPDYAIAQAADGREGLAAIRAGGGQLVRRAAGRGDAGALGHPGAAGAGGERPDRPAACVPHHRRGPAAA